MKRRWLLVALLVGVLTLGVTGGAVLAQDNGTHNESPRGKFAARVAAILGLDEAKVQDAMKQAAREMQDEALQRKLDRLVEQGRLTPEKAAEIKQWFKSRPDGMFPGLQLPGLGGHPFHRGGMMGGRGGHGMGRGGMQGGHGGDGMGFWQQMPPQPAPDSSGTTGTGL